MPPGASDSTPVSVFGNALVPDNTSNNAVRCLLVAHATATRLQEDAASSSERFAMSIGNFTAPLGHLPDLLPALAPWLLAGLAVYLVAKNSSFTYERRRTNPRRKRTDAFFKRMAAAQPRYRRNPGGVEGIIPGRLEEWRYRRTGTHTGPYKHKFNSPNKQVAMKDGSVCAVPTSRKRLWGYY